MGLRSMHTVHPPRAKKEASRPPYESRPESKKTDSAKIVEPEPHWQELIDAATD